MEEPFFTDTWDGFVIYPLGSKEPGQLFVNEKIGVLPSEVNKLFSIDLKTTADKWIIRQPVTFQNKTYFNVHRLLRAIDKNVLLSKLSKADECSPDEYFVPPSTLLDAFRQYPFIVTNTYKLIDSCHIEMDFKTDKNKKIFSSTKEDDRILLQKLTADGFAFRYGDYITLVAASSIIRPGVASSGMMRAYIERYHDPENIDYIHPIMKELLQETFGVMVFQEDVIKVAHHFAGLDMGEADILRRAMSGKFRGNEEMLRIKQKFFTNCKERNYPDATSAEIWRQIESFGGYSFSKAHSASYAVESYQSLYLKTYYPKEFMVAVINNFGGFYSTELYFSELRKTGAAIHLPDVNESEYYTNIKGNDVYTGFVHIKSLQQEMAEKIITERKRAGSYLAFCTFLDVNLDWIDTVHFPDSLRYYGIKGRGFYKITGKVVSDFGVFSIEVNKMEKVGYKERKYADL